MTMAEIRNISEPRRPAVRYHGGKWKLAPAIIAQFPAHRVYVEPFGGGASVLLRKPRAHAEVYNDLDGEIVNLFRVLRDYGDALRRVIALTPYAREEFALSYTPSDDPIEQARRTLVRSFMGFGSAAVNGQASGFRANSSRSPTPCHDWHGYPDAMRAVIERMRGVIIENRDAEKVMRAHDSDHTLHYVDPPYVHATRCFRECSVSYRHELRDADHRALATTLRALRGFVVLSGYRCALYDELFGDWRRVDLHAHADGAKPRIESLWLSPNCQSNTLFHEAMP